MFENLTTKVHTDGMTEEWLTTEQVAKKLKISANAVRKLIQRGRLAGIKVGRDWIVKSFDLEAYIQHEKRKPGRPSKSS